MTTNLKEFESLGGFSIGDVSIVDKDKNAKELNTLQVKNSFYSDSNSTKYILRGVNTATLQLDNVGTNITLENNTMNFITGHFIAVNPTGVVYSGKLESAVYVGAAGATSVLSTMETIIKHDVPQNESWTIQPFTATNRFSYATVRTGTVQTIKWAVSTEVVSIDWA
tara:strand:- start:38 stop:538 length:501 start_codon:yes stop_codon:yes gene_type:complete